jgi:hypothetical protein
MRAYVPWRDRTCHTRALYYHTMVRTLNALRPLWAVVAMIVKNNSEINHDGMNIR